MQVGQKHGALAGAGGCTESCARLVRRASVARVVSASAQKERKHSLEVERELERVRERERERAHQHRPPWLGLERDEETLQFVARVALVDFGVRDADDGSTSDSFPLGPERDATSRRRRRRRGGVRRESVPTRNKLLKFVVLDVEPLRGGRG